MQNISKLFTRKTCYQNMLGKYIKVFKSCASLTLNRMHVVYWKNNKQQHRVQLQIFPTVETQVIFEVFFSKLCSKFGACKCGNRGLGLGSALAPTSLISTSSRVIGDPPKGVKGSLTPLTFKNVQIHLNCRKERISKLEKGLLIVGPHTKWGQDRLWAGSTAGAGLPLPLIFPCNNNDHIFSIHHCFTFSLYWLGIWDMGCWQDTVHNGVRILLCAGNLEK